MRQRWTARRAGADEIGRRIPDAGDLVASSTDRRRDRARIERWRSPYRQHRDGPDAAAQFLAEVDSDRLHNASTQFADGSEFGMGAEMVSRPIASMPGPVGLEQLHVQVSPSAPTGPALTDAGQPDDPDARTIGLLYRSTRRIRAIGVELFALEQLALMRLAAGIAPQNLKLVDGMAPLSADWRLRGSGGSPADSRDDFEARQAPALRSMRWSSWRRAIRPPVSFG